MVLAFNQPFRNWLAPAKQGRPGQDKLIQVSGERLSLDALVQLVRTRLPEGRISSINISARSDKAVEMRLKMRGDAPKWQYAGTDRPLSGQAVAYRAHGNQQSVEAHQQLGTGAA
jgi:hypothetical protein